MNLDSWTDVTSGVERWLELQSGRSSAGGWRHLGRANPRNDRWLVLDLRQQNMGADRLTDLCLSGERGPDHETAFPVEEHRFADDMLHIRVPAGLPRSSRRCRRGS